LRRDVENRHEKNAKALGKDGGTGAAPDRETAKRPPRAAAKPRSRPLLSSILSRAQLGRQRITF
jgi:hypothetical protein